MVKKRIWKTFKHSVVKLVLGAHGKKGEKLLESNNL